MTAKVRKDLKSCVVGQAQVIFGGAIKIDVGTVVSNPQAFAIGLSELKHPAPSAGMVPESDETFGIQVSLVFPDLPTLSHFRDILNEVETQIKEEDANRRNHELK